MAEPAKGRWGKSAAHWREGDRAFISAAFSWQLPDARKIAEYYRALGCHVIAGGPGVFTRRNYLADLCEVPVRTVMRRGKDGVLRPVEVPAALPDTVRRHNPMATRASFGCPVGCHFCIVPQMDGLDFTFVDNFTPRPLLCDDNLSALPADFQRHIIARYQATGVPLLDANSGFEPATFDDEVYARWQPILKGPWRFGFDEATEGANVDRVFKMLARKGVKPRRIQVYTMIGHEPFDVCMDRIQRVRAGGGEPYAQPFINLNALQKVPRPRYDWTPQLLTDVARWVNRRIWRKVPNFADYNRSAKGRGWMADADGHASKEITHGD